ncbi:unnamed protein product [Cuscuta campestris]|uniref:Uncharacterized protein n=1 Tax=Cuscuta campestris TaxID=132261 RepID=A0A484NJR6_9ASTE|nr:unnamed protein product [Cuscuta campestris]
MKLNALEDAAPENDEPALYTHSEGETTVFIDSKVEPIRINTSRCSKVSMLLPKLAKGKPTFSPSHMVTRSRAKIIAAGRKENPIKGVGTSEDEGEFTVKGIHSAFKKTCPTIGGRKNQSSAHSLESQPKHSKKQKRKAKQKLKHAQTLAMANLALSANNTMDTDDIEDDYDFSYYL